MQKSSLSLSSEQYELLMELSFSYIWWASPEESLQYPERLIAQIMNLGTLEDTVKFLLLFSLDDLKYILKIALAGWFLPKSWNFWHLRLGYALDNIPPLPRRKLRLNIELPEEYQSFGSQSSTELSFTSIRALTPLSKLTAPLATKLRSLTTQINPQNHLDIYRLLQQGGNLEQGLVDAISIYGSLFTPMWSLKSLVYFNHPELDEIDDEVKNFLIHRVCEVDLGRVFQILESKN